MKSRRFFSIILAMLMLLSVVPMTAFAEETHTHAMSCSCSTADGSQIEFVPFDPANYYITEDSNFYLTEDVYFKGNDYLSIKENVTVNLCLNGHKIHADESTIYLTFISQNSTLNICDCSAEQSGGYVNNGNNAYIGNFSGTVNVYNGTHNASFVVQDSSSEDEYDTVLNVYGGTFTTENSYTFYSYDKTFINFYGGTIKNSSSGIYINDETTLVMDGGKINSITNCGVRVASQGEFHFKSGEIIDCGHEPIYSEGKFVMTGGKIHDNVSHIYISGSASISNAEVYNNTDSNSGGALFVADNAVITISDSEFYNNYAECGGAIVTDCNVQLNISNSKFYNNNAAIEGGALYSNTDNNITVSNCEFYGNSADNDSSAIYTPSPITVTDTLIYGNNTSGNYAVYAAKTITLSGKIYIADNVINGTYNEEMGIYEGSAQGNLDANCVISDTFEEGSKLAFCSKYNNGDILAVPDGTNLTALDEITKYVVLDNSRYAPFLDASGNIIAVEVIEEVPTASSPAVKVFEDYAENATYQWYENGVLMENETSPSIVPKIGKNYTSIVIFPGGGTAVNRFTFVAEIVEQPTLETPVFEVTMSDLIEKYEWYVTAPEANPITDKNASNECTNCEGDYTSTYDAENDLWTGSKVGDYEDGIEMFYFTVPLKKDDTLYVNAGPEVKDIFIFDKENLIPLYPSFSMVGNVKVFTAEEDGNYTVSAYVLSNDVKISAFRIKLNEEALMENETENELSNLQVGSRYYCVATYQDGTTLISDSFAAYPELISEPDLKHPTLKVTFENEAKFKWYEIDKNDNSFLLENETSNTLSSLELDKTYYCIASYPFGMNIISDKLSVKPEIILQPTVQDPTIEVTFENDAKFQWYEAIKRFAIIDDLMVDYIYNEYDKESNRWIPNVWPSSETEEYIEYGLEYFCIKLKKGDIVKVTLSNPDAVSKDNEFRFSPDNYSTVHVEPEEDGTYIFTAPYTDTYDVYNFSYDDSTTATFEIVKYDLTAIDGETEKTLSEYERNKIYIVQATYPNDTVLESEAFEAIPAIIQQPTAEAPTVEINFEEDGIKYQWYEVIFNNDEVTDKNASGAYWDGESIGEPSYYDEENKCWIPSLYDIYTDGNGTSYYNYDIFKVELKAGESLIITPSAEIKDDYDVSYSDTYDGFVMQTIDGIFHLTSAVTQEYTIYVDTYEKDITFTAVISGKAVYEAVEGATSKTFTPFKDGKFVCVITYEDGTELVSDLVKFEAEVIGMLGDINNDGDVDQYDYILAKRIHFNNYTPTAEQMRLGDVDKDGDNDQYDYILIKRHHFGNYVITD